jgi:hypothetical protein
MHYIRSAKFKLGHYPLGGRFKKGGVRGSDGPFARRKNEQNPCLG